jgi:hypothetical protein
VSYLFVGGPYHGEMREVPQRHREVFYDNTQDQPEASFVREGESAPRWHQGRHGIYRLERIVVFGKTMLLYVDSGLAGELRDNSLASLLLSGLGAELRDRGARVERGL